MCTNRVRVALSILFSCLLLSFSMVGVGKSCEGCASNLDVLLFTLFFNRSVCKDRVRDALPNLIFCSLLSFLHVGVRKSCEGCTFSFDSVFFA